jgi:hypothetical protein
VFENEGLAMKSILKMTLAVAAVCAFTGSAQAGGCVLAGGEATMVTQDLAKFMASAALKNSIPRTIGNRAAPRR